MTAKEAIIQLEDLIQDRKSFLSDDEELNEIYCKDINALDMTIQALEKQIPKKPTAEPYFYGIKEFDRGQLDFRKIKLLPNTEKVTRTGQWVYGEYDIPHCSECGIEIMNISKFCPNCGAKMESEE